MYTDLNGHVAGNSNNDITKPKQTYIENTKGVKIKGRYVKHPYLKK